MKHNRFIIVAALMLAAAICLGSCGVQTAVEVSNDVYGYSFTNPKTGVTYVSCSSALMPVTVGDLYCQTDSTNRFRTIKFEDPLRFLCDDTEFAPGVYRASDIPEITMQNFNPVASQVFIEGDVSVYVGQLNAEKKYLSESVQDLIDSYSEGESPIPDDSEYIYAIRDAMQGEPDNSVYPYEGTIDDDSMLHLHLLSPDFPGLTYLVVYYRTLDGRDYLFDYGTKLSYECPLGVALRLWEFLG